MVQEITVTAVLMMVYVLDSWGTVKTPIKIRERMPMWAALMPFGWAIFWVKHRKEKFVK